MKASSPEFDEEASGIDSERTWTITMHAKKDLPPPESFTFGAPRVAAATNEHFRYVDADLATVADTIPLERQYAKAGRAWLWWIPGGIALLAAGWFALRRARRPEQAAAARFRVPEPVNPFTVLGLLRDIQTGNGLADEQHLALAREIETLERHYFGDEELSPPDLQRIAQDWVSKAR